MLPTDVFDSLVSKDDEGEDAELLQAIEASLRDSHAYPRSPSSGWSFRTYYNPFLDSDEEHERAAEHVHDGSDDDDTHAYPNPLIHLRNLVAMIESWNDDVHSIGPKCVRDGCNNCTIVNYSFMHDGFCSERCSQMETDRERRRRRRNRRRFL